MTTNWGVRLAEIELPDLSLPREVPTVQPETYRKRLGETLDAMAGRGLDALVVYGDREHFANLAYLTGFDPRWEESLMVIIPGQTPVLIVGNEDVNYAGVTPYPVDIVRLSKFSLTGQPDPGDVTLQHVLHDAGIADSQIQRVGIAGWKWWQSPSAAGWIEVPHFIVVEIEKLVASVENASDIFTGEEGLRLKNEADQIAFYEFSASHSSTAMLRLLNGIRPGMTELEASALMKPILLPFSYHPTMLSGPQNTKYGVASPGGRVVEVGDRVCAGLGYWGSNTARAGYLVENQSQLPSPESDYIDAIVAPYYATAAAWYETIRIGVTAGELYEVTASRIGDDRYGVFLNPGHFIHLDEWPMSPVREGSNFEFASGAAIQLDIIPAPATHQNSQIEDGIVLADADLRVELATKYPEMVARIETRRSTLKNVFGIELHESVLPMSNTAGYLPPFWLSPNYAMIRG